MSRFEFGPTYHQELVPNILDHDTVPFDFRPKLPEFSAYKMIMESPCLFVTSNCAIRANENNNILERIRSNLEKLNS